MTGQDSNTVFILTHLTRVGQEFERLDFALPQDILNAAASLRNLATLLEQMCVPLDAAAQNKDADAPSEPSAAGGTSHWDALHAAIQTYRHLALARNGPSERHI